MTAFHDLVYTDGGVILTNPSPFGGAWAWCSVDPLGNREPGGSGLLLPADVGLPFVTNNVTELYAAVAALEVAPEGWDGTLHTDSQCTLARLLHDGASMRGVPLPLQERLAAALRRAGRFRAVLLDGHPTRKQLAAGVGKRGSPVSSHNVYCDKVCGRLQEKWVEANPAEVAAWRAARPRRKAKAPAVGG